MITKIITEKYIFYKYDNYDEHKIKIIMSDNECNIFLFNEEIDNKHVRLSDNTVYLLSKKEALPIISVEEIESFIELYRVLHNDETSYELVHLFKNSLSTHKDKEKWFKYFKYFSNTAIYESDEIVGEDIPITIYRGCYDSEIKANDYGISWTYDKKIAFLFNDEVIEEKITLGEITYIIGGREKEVIYKRKRDKQ